MAWVSKPGCLNQSQEVRRPANFDPSLHELQFRSMGFGPSKIFWKGLETDRKGLTVECLNGAGVKGVGSGFAKLVSYDPLFSGVPPGIIEL